MVSLGMRCSKCGMMISTSLIEEHVREAHKPYWLKMKEKRQKTEVECNA